MLKHTPKSKRAWLKSCVLLVALLIVLQFLPLPQTHAAENAERPVWNIAFVLIRGQVTVQVGGELRYIPLLDDSTIDFITDTSAARLKESIERYSNNAVDIRITVIHSFENHHFVSSHNDFIRALNVRITTTMIAEHNLAEFDTWVGVWPFQVRRAYANFNSANNSRAHQAYRVSPLGTPREIYMFDAIFPVSPTTSNHTTRMNQLQFNNSLIHEFLHQTEFWFRDTLHFPLPYEIPHGLEIRNPNDRNALHNPEFFGFPRTDSFTLPVPPWYAAWFAFDIPDPRRPGRYLGIPPQAWNYTPTNGRRPTGYDPGTIQPPPRICCCIDHSQGDLIVQSTSADNFTINLTQEAVNLGGGTVTAYSVNGRPANVRRRPWSDEVFRRLLGRNLALELTVDGQTVTFPTINARARTPRLRINYAIAANGGTHGRGQWVLTERNGQTAVKENIEVGIAERIPQLVPYRPPRPGRNINANGWGRFRPGTDNGICVRPLHISESGRPQVLRTTYFFRQAPTQNADGTYTAASRKRRVRALGQQRAPNLRIRVNGTITIRDNTFINGTLANNGVRGPVPAAPGDRVRIGATARRPATAEQMLVAR